MGLLLFDRNMFRNCVRASHPAQPRPAQRVFSFVFWEGEGRERKREGGIRLAGQKNPPAERTLASWDIE